MVLGLALLTGCSPLTDQGARVVLVDDAKTLGGCERSGRVAEQSVFGGIFSYVGCQRVRAKMRNATADQNGTHVVITSLTCGVFGDSEGEGDVYRCGLGDVPEP